MAAGCGAQLGDGLGPADASVGLDALRRYGDAPLDAAPDGPPIAPDNACDVPSSQGDLGALTASAIVTGPAPFIYDLEVTTPASAGAPAPDQIIVELWDGFGAFLNTTVAPGTYQISGDDTSYETCGICVLELANVDSSDTPTHMLIAQTGTVIVHAVGTTVGAELDAEVTDATFEEIDPSSYAPITT